MPSDRTKAKASPPRPRKVIVVLTDEEWRRLRVRVAERDTTLQAYLTEIVLRDLRRS